MADPAPPTASTPGDDDVAGAGAVRDELATWSGVGEAANTSLGTAVAVPPSLARVRTGPDRGLDQAIREREAATMRGFVTLVSLLILGIVVTLPWIAQSWRSGYVLIGAAMLAGAGATRAWWVLRRTGRIGNRDVLAFGLTALLGGMAGIYCFGFFSPAPLVTIMGVFFFGMQRNLGVALTIYLGSAVLHGAAMALMTAGVIVDRGLVTANEVTIRNRIVMIVLVEVVLGLTYYLARAVQRAIVETTARLEEQTRAVAHREALLEEARRELERALEIGGPGRFTEQLLGPWKLGVLCGRGAMGDVYEAVHVGTGARAAVKLLHRETLQHPGHIRRFLREARIAASIDVANVVRVLEIGDEDAPVPYIAMERLEGQDLGSILRRQRKLPHPEAVDLLRQVGRGLDAAHRAGVIHRDLKPHNLFRAEVDGGHVWKILDFGVSRLIDGESSLTRGQAVGTPAYMSPEQARGRDVDHRADLFALGVLAYRVFTGRPAFTGHEVPQILYSVVHGMPPRPSDLANVPTAVDDVLAIAMAKRPDDRFDCAAEMVDALERGLAGELSADLRARAARLTLKRTWGRHEEDLLGDHGEPRALRDGEPRRRRSSDPVSRSAADGGGRRGAEPRSRRISDPAEGSGGGEPVVIEELLESADQ